MKDMHFLRQQSLLFLKDKIILNFEKRENTPNLAISVSSIDRVVNLGALPFSFIFNCP